jgi:hypothetical protein
VENSSAVPNPSLKWSLKLFEGPNSVFRYATKAHLVEHVGEYWISLSEDLRKSNSVVYGGSPG